MRSGANTKQNIHAAALALFVDRGVTETSVRDLAAAAGIAEGTLYRHYLSKDDLVADLFATNYAAFAHRLATLRDVHNGFGARLDAVVAEVCGFYDAEPTLFRFLLLAQHQALPRVEEGPDNPVTILRGMVAEAIRDGEIGMDEPELATAMVLGLLLQPATAVVYGRLAPPLSRLIPQIAASCRRALAFSSATGNDHG